MPLYLYRCLLCDEEIERLVTKMNSPPPVCPACLQGEMEQQVAPVSPFRWGRGGGWS